MNRRLATAIGAALASMTLITTPAAAAGGAPTTLIAPHIVNQGSESSIFGVLTVKEGVYTLGEWTLSGNDTHFARYAGTYVLLIGQPAADGTKTFTVRDLALAKGQQPEPNAVAPVLKDVTAGQGLPTLVSFEGKAIRFDQGAEVVDGTLMVPLRAVVEAAGGSVEWDEAAQSVRVEMADRQAWFWVGNEKAEMYENNVRYLQRNLVAMAKAPVLKSGRIMVSADALTHILGLLERADNDAALDLVAR